MRRILALALLALLAAPAAAQQAEPAPAQPIAAPPSTANPPRAAPQDADTDADDLQALRQEYLRLRDLLFRSRARAAAVSDAMFSTRVSIRLRFANDRFCTVDRASIRLDGASVFDDSGGSIAANAAPRFEGFIAPGRHLIAVRIETTGKEDARFSSALESSFAIQAPAGTDLTIDLIAKDDGDIAYAWNKGQRGSYKLRLDADITAKERSGEKAAR